MMELMYGGMVSQMRKCTGCHCLVLQADFEAHKHWHEDILAILDYLVSEASKP